MSRVYAFVADLHGDEVTYARLVESLDRDHPDAELVLLGDYLEALVPKERHVPGRRRPLDEVVADQPVFWKQLVHHQRVRGNQEERIAEALDLGTAPEALRALLSAPESVVVDGARLVHGHRLDWVRTATGPYRPRVPKRELLDQRVLFFGHSHRIGLYRLDPGPDGCQVTQVVLTPGRETFLVDGFTYLVNVPPAVARRPRWARYDSDRGSITVVDLAESEAA